MKKLFFLSAVTLLLAGCVSDDVKDYGINDVPTYEGIPGGFDYSTTNDVQLNVDYSACAPMSSVFFSVYEENPMTGDALDENIKPIFSSYTKPDGTYNETVTLPASAEKIYVYSGDFFVGGGVIESRVNGNTATVVAQGTTASARAAAPASRRALSTPSGIQTNSLETLYQLSYEVDWQTGEKKATKHYNDWVTPLGTWDKETGRPDYLMTPNTLNYSELTFTDDEKKGLYQAISGAITRKQTCPMEYRQPADLTLTQNSEVAVTLIGSNTCWNNVVGYYYYKEGETPTRETIHPIMLFPNTQDGRSQFVNEKHGGRYYGNIALERGDAVKLMYYPHIAEGNMDDATPEFPAGTCIGFLLKSNGWGMQLPQGNKVFYNGYRSSIKKGSPGYDISRQYNTWSASTNGLSLCIENAEQAAVDEGIYATPNPNGDARTAKFAYQNADGQQYAIVAFEDAANDVDYGDVILAMKPVGVFKLLPTVKPRTTTTKGVYAFEDLWPAKGDYDMNDAVVDYKENREYSVLEYGGEYKVTKQTFYLTTYRNYVTKKNGLAVQLNTPVTPSKVVMKKITNLESGEEVDAQFKVDGNVYLLTDDMINEINVTYILELTYASGINDGNAAKVKPFIYRDETNNKRWEVHIPMEAPTDKMNFSYFGTSDDNSDPEKGLYYVRKGNYPFSFFLADVTVDVFKNTILKGDMNKHDKSGNEGKSIDQFFPKFIDWSQSNGAKSKDWYKHPVAQ